MVTTIDIQDLSLEHFPSLMHFIIVTLYLFAIFPLSFLRPMIAMYFASVSVRFLKVLFPLLLVYLIFITYTIVVLL